MFELSNNNIITITRGDTASFYFFVNVCNSVFIRKYKLKEGDSIYFGVMEANQPFEHALIRKKYTYEDVDEYGVINIELKSTDTINLLPGNYYYEIKLQTDKDIVTLVNRRKFIILE